MNMQKEMDMFDDEAFNKNIQDIRNSTKFLTNTINDFRKFFDKDKKIVEIQSNEIIEKIINLVSHRINKSNVEIIKNYKCEKPILTYLNELQQVILNIFNNAFDEFESKQMEEPKITIIGQELNNNFLEIIISDNAGGIPDDIIDKIFDPYFSTKSKNGTGLGLYMSKMIVHDSLKGDLSVKNNKDGAVFIIKIPKKNLR
jgi:signal transduction histidine kinase